MRNTAHDRYYIATVALQLPSLRNTRALSRKWKKSRAEPGNKCAIEMQPV
jgi:hypothetical protein